MISLQVGGSRLGGLYAGVAAAALAIVLAQPASADARCRKYQHRANVESGIFKTDLAYLYIRQKVCFKGSRITRVGKFRIKPVITNNGDRVNEKWNGFVTRPYSRTRRWHGRRNGARVIYADGQFEQELCFGPCYKSTSYVWAKMIVYGNGDVKKERKNDS